MKLKDCVNIRTGLILSRKLSEEDFNYEYKSINLTSVYGGVISKETLDVFRTKEELKEDYLTKEGDIIVRLTRPYTAVLITKEDENIVISSNFLKLTCDKEKVLPQYLYWLLNTERIKHKIFQNSVSNVLDAITANTYGNLLLNLVPIDKQRIIGNLYLLTIKENELISRLQEEKQKLNNAIIRKINEN